MAIKMLAWLLRREEKGGENLTSSSTYSSSKHKNLICNYCKKKWHIKADCFKLKNKQKADQGDSSSGYANLVEIQGDDVL